MKTDIHVKSLAKRLEDLLSGSSPSILKWDNGPEGISNKTITQQQEELDDIETEKYGQPLRFADYRHARCKKTAPALKLDGEGFTCEDVYDTITQEELDYELRYRLKVSPEDRYAHGKYHWYSHPSSWYVRVPHQGYDGQGCTGKACVQECRFYNKTGRIEDAEIIEEHKKLEQSYKDKDAIVAPPHPSEYFYHPQKG
jgi:hypothetical protein